MSQFFRKLSSCVLVNDYGPSETHVVTSYRLPRTRDHWPPLPPIGYPIANTQMFILDAHGNRVPIGMSSGHMIPLLSLLLSHGFLCSLPQALLASL